MEHGKKLDLFRVVIEEKMCSFVGPSAHTARFVKYLPFFQRLQSGLDYEHQERS